MEADFWIFWVFGAILGPKIVKNPFFGAKMAPKKRKEKIQKSAFITSSELISDINQKTRFLGQKIVSKNC